MDQFPNPISKNVNKEMPCPQNTSECLEKRQQCA